MRREPVVGGVYATLAFGTWGLSPLYWRAILEFLPAAEMVAQRVLWALPVVVALVAARGRLREALGVARHGPHLRLLVASGLLLAANWAIFLWAIQARRLTEASLGYYVNPLVNVLLGVVFLGERLTRRQGLAVAIAAGGVAWLTVAQGALPWVALTLAVTFGFYGLLRKRAAIEPLVGLAVETAVLAPLGAAYVAIALARGESGWFSRGAAGAALVPLSGLLTALPLLWFALAAKRLRYATVGFFQYLNPTIQLALGALVFREAFTSAHAVAFGAIAVAAALYVADALGRARLEGPPSPPAE